MNNKEKILIMKTKITSAIAIVAIALTMALNVNLSAKSNSLSDISLANVEALAYVLEIDGLVIGECGDPWDNVCFNYSGIEFPGVLYMRK